MGVLRKHHSFDGCVIRRDHQSDVDINTNMIERSDGIAHAYDCVVRRDYQYDIDIDIDMILFLRDHDCTCSGTCQFRGRGRGKSKGKLANDQKLTYDVSLCFGLFYPYGYTVIRHSQGKMPPRKGARRGASGGGRGAGRTQPEEQLVAQATNPTAFVTQADLAAMEKRYQDMSMDALAPFHAAQQTQAAPTQTPVVPQVVPDQLSIEAKHLRDFSKYNPKTFDGSIDNPTKAQIWLTSIETIFRYMKCPDDQKVQCAVFFLEDRGTTWWETYDAEFDMLSRFAPDVVKDEATRTEKFVRALDLSLHERADPSKTAGRGSTLGQKRKVESQPVLAPQRDLRSGGVFQQYRQELAAAGRTLRELPACRRYGRVHGGCCLIGSGVRFRCKQPGHTADVCPQKLIGTTSHQPPASQQGRVFVTTRQEAERAGTVVIVFVRQMGLEVEPLGSILSISTPSGTVMLSKDKIKACQVGVANHVLDVTLQVLDMHDFDVLLGMDWLSANHASIDCSRKEVVFNPLLATSFKFKRAGTVVLPKVILALKANKLLNQGTWGILASMVDTRESKVSLSSESMVREYPDVFPDELPELPPLREIDFAIKLESGTAPISRAPNRMAPVELKELKVQLQELLDKGFIRPSMSP
ncbi:gag protease polyprotein [Cucumis melo var. makuwa]|uniref:Gag protease polyprotein n=1 Tax=Cucumis melo var. makuwa TaxID=1194695 RepID=A0A5D3E367_CUCMM|nr:gag protease polyprotein [Cucumis melo var. makuwa]